MPAPGLVDFHVVTRHAKLEELLIFTHELQMNDLSADSLRDQVRPGIPDGRAALCRAIVSPLRPRSPEQLGWTCCGTAALAPRRSLEPWPSYCRPSKILGT